jgi:hypothetical protein
MTHLAFAALAATILLSGTQSPPDSSLERLLACHDHGAGLERVVGVLYLVIAAWSFYGTAVNWGAPRLPGLLDDWLYPVVQPVARTLIGVWLWRSPPVVLSPAPVPG